LGDTNVLATRFQTRSGRVRLTDFMPVWSEDDKRRRLVSEHEILRIVDGEEGDVELALDFSPRPDYARRAATLRATSRLGVRIEDGAALYTLRGDAELQLRDDGRASAS